MRLLSGALMVGGLLLSGCGSTESGKEIQILIHTNTDASKVSLVLDMVGSGKGTVSTDKADVSCTTNCFIRTDKDSTIQLMAKPAAGSVFVGFEGLNCPPTSDTCSLKMSGDAEGLARFDLKP